MVPARRDPELRLGDLIIEARHEVLPGVLLPVLLAVLDSSMQARQGQASHYPGTQLSSERIYCRHTLPRDQVTDGGRAKADDKQHRWKPLERRKPLQLDLRLT